MDIEDGSLGTPRAKQIRTIGSYMGKFMESNLIELCLDAMTNMGQSIGNYREDLDNKVQRYIKIEEREGEAGYLEIEVRFTNWKVPEARYRIHIKIEELET